MSVESNPPISQQNGHYNAHSNGYQNGHMPPAGAYVTPFTTPYPQSDLDLSQLLQIVRRRAWLIGGVAIAVTSIVWGWTLTRTAIYRGEFRVLVEPVTGGDRSQELLQGTQGAATLTFDYATQIEVLRSPALLQPIAEELQETYPDIHYGLLASNLIITRMGDTKVLAVSYLDPNPERIREVLQALSDHYLRYSFQQRQTSLQQGIQFVDDQLPELRERVNSLQLELERFRQRYSLIDPQLRGDDLSNLISSVENQRQETETQLAEARSLYSTLQAQLGYGPDVALASATLSESSGYQAILGQIQEVERQIAAESARFLPNSPNIQVLEDRRASLLPLLDEEARRLLGSDFANGVSDRLTNTSLELSRDLIATANQVTVLEARSDALAEVEARLKQEFSLVPALSRQYTDLQRELTIATESLNRFLATRENLQIEAAQKSIPWELISQASVSPLPISPNVPRNLLLGAIAGLVLGSTAALLAEKLDNAFHSPEELKSVTRLPLLGVVPFDKDLQGSATPAEPVMVSDRTPSSATPASSRSAYYHTSPFFESFRSLYANLRFLSSDTPIRSLVISSASPSEGKSTVSLHLAKAAAAMGQRVLLVDADLRCPRLHERLNLPNLQGVSNLLTSDLPLAQAIQRVSLSESVARSEENLYVLTAGAVPPDPVKLLSSRKMQRLMAQVHLHFDLTIYDMPPMVGFADSNVLAVHTDGMVVVVGLGKTDRSSLLQALEGLKISPVNVLGMVANGIKAYTTHSYGYYQYRYSRYNATEDPQTSAIAPITRNLPTFPRPNLTMPEVPSRAIASSRLYLLLLAGTGITVLLILSVWFAYTHLIRNLPPETPPTSTRLQ